MAARLPVGMHSNLVIVEMSIPELTRAGLLDPKGQRGFLERAYQVYWWVVVIVVLLIPTRSDQLSFYFPAVLGLMAAWLFAMPVYAQGLMASSADFAALRPSPNIFREFVDRMRARPVKLPEVLYDDAQVAEGSAMMAKEMPALIPSTLLVIMAQLSSRVVATGIVAVIGMHAGPWLVSIHLSWLRDWSPIAVLYALSAPALPFVLGSLLIPILGYAYLASRRAQQHLETRTEPK